MTYKDSGIEWIGKIPENWSIVQIGSLYFERNEHVSALDFEPLSVTKKGVVPQLDTAAKSDNPNDRKLVKINDFAINSRSDRRGSCGISQYDGSVSLINTVLVPLRSDLISNKFYEYVFHTSMFADEFYRWGHGIVDDLWTTKWQEMKKIGLPFPSYEEQNKISSFLDRKTNRANALIDNLNNQIDKLKEYKKALITKCVTKGLDPNVPLKDSGIEWIGEIPENWNLIKAKRCIMIQNGSDPKTEGDIPVYGSGSSTFKTCGEFKNGPAVLLGRKGSISTPHYVEGKYWNVDTAFNVSTNEFMSLRYYFYLANCFDYSYYMSQTTLPSMTQTNYENMSIPLPNNNLQNEIVSYLDAKCSEIDSLISSKQQQIDKLNEYQKSLIYEYVTGKKEVV